MINEEIIAYIQTQLRKNISKDVIISKLRKAGWREDDIDESFRKLTPPEIKKDLPTPPPQNNSIPEQPKKVDMYREAPVIATEESALIKPFEVKQQTTQKSEEKIGKPIFSSSFSEANRSTEAPSYYIPNNSFGVTQAKVGETVNKNINFDVMKPKIVAVPENNGVLTNNKSQDSFAGNQEFIPTLTPKLPSQENVSIQNIPTQTMYSDSLKAMEPSVEIPTSAILHSYPQILSSSMEANNKIFVKKKRNILKLLVWVLIVSALAGIVFAFSLNYIKIPSFKFSFIKKDPKTLLLQAPVVLSGLKSYKIETIANVSSPAFADITNGLVTGEAIQSTNRDYISLSARSMVNNNNQTVPIFDYLATIKSSLWKNDIITDIKYDNKTFVSIPDLSELFGRNAPIPRTVSIDKGQFSSIINLLPENIYNKVSKVDVEKLLSTTLPSYITNETASVFKDFVTSASVIEKASEKVRGIDTYHYVLGADREATKVFLDKFASIFITNISPAEKESLNQVIGATTVDLFEIWIGKDDGDIHQYRFTLTTPLSKILRLDDKGIAGNTVSLDWKTTYYDFNVPNTISLPEDSISMGEFVSGIGDQKIKNAVSSFKTLADDFKHSVGNFGKKSNPTGSCTNPNPGSLFSPVGQPKGAVIAVGNIAGLMNTILSTTNGALSCYSSTDAWAISAPLVSDPNSSFCYDSTGNSKTLTTVLKGTECK